MDTTIRYLEMLQFLPRYPRKKSLYEIRNHLSKCGFIVSDRTIQRDLKKLETPFGLICDDRSIPFGWSFNTVAKRSDISEIDESEALLLMLMKEHLLTAIPLDMFPRMELIFKKATKVLNDSNKDKLNKWKTKIKTKSASMNYIPPKTNKVLSSKIVSCLLEETQFMALYVSRNGKSNHIYNPLALVSHGNIQRLICTRDDSEDLIRHLPLHRFRSCKQLKKNANIPNGFDVNNYLKTGEIEFLYKKNINFEADFRLDSGIHLFDTPISENQILKINKEKKYINVKATINDTETLRRWILSFGIKVNVKKPAYLKKIIKLGNP